LVLLLVAVAVLLVGLLWLALYAVRHVGRRNATRWWLGLISNIHGSSPGMTAVSTAIIHQSKSLELVQSQYRAPRLNCENSVSAQFPRPIQDFRPGAITGLDLDRQRTIVDTLLKHPGFDAHLISYDR
jgi:hypothetical protein